MLRPRLLLARGRLSLRRVLVRLLMLLMLLMLVLVLSLALLLLRRVLIRLLPLVLVLLLVLLVLPLLRRRVVIRLLPLVLLLLLLARGRLMRVLQRLLLLLLLLLTLAALALLLPLLPRRVLLRLLPLLLRRRRSLLLPLVGVSRGLSRLVRTLHLAVPGAWLLGRMVRMRLGSLRSGAPHGSRRPLAAALPLLLGQGRFARLRASGAGHIFGRLASILKVLASAVGTLRVAAAVAPTGLATLHARL